MNCALSQFFAIYKAKESSHLVFFLENLLNARSTRRKKQNILVKLPDLFGTTPRIVGQFEIYT